MTTILSNLTRFKKNTLEDSMVNLQLKDIKNPTAPCMLLQYHVKHYCQQNKPLTTNQN